MKKILLASVLLATTATSAATAATAATGAFGGAYVGVLGGWARNTLSTDSNLGNQSLKAAKLGKMSGWAVGPQFGYGWMVAPSFYLGLDFSFLFGGPKTKKDFQETRRGVNISDSLVLKEKFTGALMLQAGLPIGNIMPYLEAGVQLSNQEIKTNRKRTLAATGRFLRENSFKSSHTACGFAVGAGLKYSFKPVLVSLSYRFGKGINKEDGETLYKVNAHKVNAHKVLLGLSYNF